MVYRLFSSLRTSVYILSMMCLIFLIGTIFPQGENIEDYIKAGGKYVAVVRALDFLDIFMSPLFLCVTALLMINLAVCLYDRCRVFLKIKRRPIELERLKNHPNVIAYETSVGLTGGIENRLKNIGFRLRTEAAGVKIFEKGLQYWWLSWFYHVGIILAVLGFFMTALFAFENYIVLYPDKPETISLYSNETRWNQFLKKFGRETQEESGDIYILTLKEFDTEYYQGLKIDYPIKKMEKFRLGVGLKRLVPSTKGFSYMPKMWLTHLDVKRPDGSVLDARLWVNRPFRTGALTLYQMGYEQKVMLTVNGEEIEAEPHVPFQVKDVKGKFVVESLKLGTLFRKDGTTERITPVTTIDYLPENKGSEKEPLDELKLHGKIEAKGAVIEFNNYLEGSTLSYRKDPGVWLVGMACLFIFLGLIVRSLGAWYRIQYALEGTTAYVLISTRGILADRDRIAGKLKK
jgi:cytochrome c biogenesis protein ResB